MVQAFFTVDRRTTSSSWSQSYPFRCLYSTTGLSSASEKKGTCAKTVNLWKSEILEKSPAILAPCGFFFIEEPSLSSFPGDFVCRAQLFSMLLLLHPLFYSQNSFMHDYNIVVCEYGCLSIIESLRKAGEVYQLFQSKGIHLGPLVLMAST